jgi:hypothetical protein
MENAWHITMKYRMFFHINMSNGTFASSFFDIRVDCPFVYAIRKIVEAKIWKAMFGLLPSPPLVECFRCCGGHLLLKRSLGVGPCRTADYDLRSRSPIPCNPLAPAVC